MDLWQLKLAARIHDPAEKALVLYRDPSGHEGGSIVEVARELGLSPSAIQEMDPIIRKADHWAAAADRPQFPRDANERYPDWAQVRFAREGKLIHPLTGQIYDLPGIGEDILAEHIKKVSEVLFVQLIQKTDSGSPDFRRTLLAFWRFGPELGRDLEGIGHLWSLLPADTRVPDHTIWQHLDLTSALAGAMAHGSHAALLIVSVGPVQEFIAASRSTSDLWAGSHFLSMLSWQALKVIAEALGPDAILFPQLRGVPVVDLWLIEKGVQRELFEEYDAEWIDRKTDYNPLFGAALPNKFVAIVPENEGKQLAGEIQNSVRDWVQKEARAMLDMVLEEIREAPGDQHCYRQLEAQLGNFPEVHWSLVPWLPEAETKTTLAAFHPEGREPEFFSKIWEKLKQPIEPEAGWKFWEPNDGALYPVVHDCAERVLAAAKSVRPFEQLVQKGYRDSLTGEYEWLTLNAHQLEERSPRQREDTLWARVAKERPSWAKKGEHLSAFGLIKRVWPTRYMEWLKAQGITSDVNRYVISTHVMALAPNLDRMLDDSKLSQEPEQVTIRASARAELEKAVRDFEQTHYRLDGTALPRMLASRLYHVDEQRRLLVRKIPALLDARRELDLERRDEGSSLDEAIKRATGAKPETYYALILMDGDRLGAWLSGEPALKFSESFHQKVKNGLLEYNDERLRNYLELDRPGSPARHMAISAALNGFSLDLVRHVVEDLCLGKLLYSGGDDAMAMVCVRDLPKALWLLRLVYSGDMQGDSGSKLFDHDLDIKRGFVKWRNRLYRVMGERATASVGAVIAHHMAPLGAVLRHLRGAERDAKGKGGRNAFSFRILKRAGGRQDLTLPWWLGEDENAVSTMYALEALRKAIAGDLSRRAAYHVEEWIRGFPLLDDVDQLRTLIARNVEYQFERKARKGATIPREDAERVATVAVREAMRRLETKRNPDTGALAQQAYEVVQGLLSTAEFLAREARGSEIAEPARSTREARHG